MKKPLEIIKEFKLEYYFNIILEHNKANQLAYHNLFHTLCVMKNCYEIVMNLEHYESQDAKMTMVKLRLLCIAALFHDFNHSGGKLKDDKNVDIALMNFYTFSKESDKDNKTIESIIEATEYPYVIEGKDLTPMQMIIRDADLLQACEDNWLQQNIVGLGTEMNVELIPMLEGSKNFWDKIFFHTGVATEKWNNIKEIRFKEVDYLLEILK